METSAFKDRLPSAFLALLIQAGVIGLLVFSFEAVRPQHEQESILFLSPPLARKATPSITTIDARGAPLNRNRSVKAPALPLLAQPTSTKAAPTTNALSSPGAMHSLGRTFVDCAPEKLANLSANERANCPPSVEGMAKQGGSDVITSPYQAKDEARWNEEMARKNAPVGPPGGSISGAIMTLLTHPSAFADKKNYTYASPTPPQMSGADALYHATQVAPDCPVMSDFEREACENAVAALGGGNQHVAVAAPSPPKIHASEAQFQAAMKAYHQLRGGRPLIAVAQNPQ